MNAIEIKCSKCRNKYLISRDELVIFENGECGECMSKETRFFKNRIVEGYYDLPEINAEIANKIVEKEIKLLERRAYPRINLKEI